MPITGRGPASEGGNISEPIVKGSIVLSGFAGTYLFPPGVARQVKEVILANQVKSSIALSAFAGTDLFPPGVARLKSQYDTQQPRMGFLCPQRTCFFHISRYLRR
jgi:hypothetical protein